MSGSCWLGDCHHEDSTNESTKRDGRSLGLICSITLCYYRVPTKQGKWPKDFPVREKTGKLEIFAKTQGIWFAQVEIS